MYSHHSWRRSLARPQNLFSTRAGAGGRPRARHTVRGAGTPSHTVLSRSERRQHVPVSDVTVQVMRDDKGDRLTGPRCMQRLTS